MNDKEYYPDYHVSDIMCKIYKRNDIPFIDTKNRQGVTGYIDYIDASEVTHPIMKGSDHIGRKVIIMQFIVNKKIYIQTFFQRYSNWEYTWMSARVTGSPTFISSIGGMTRYQANFLLDVSLGNKVKLDTEHKTVYDTISKSVYVMLYDKKKDDSAKIIQRYWDICRYNTGFKIARDYVTRDYKEYVRDVKSF